MVSAMACRSVCARRHTRRPPSSHVDELQPCIGKPKTACPNQRIPEEAHSLGSRRMAADHYDLGPGKRFTRACRLPLCLLPFDRSGKSCATKPKTDVRYTLAAGNVNCKPQPTCPQDSAHSKNLAHSLSQERRFASGPRKKPKYSAAKAISVAKINLV